MSVWSTGLEDLYNNFNINNTYACTDVLVTQKGKELKSTPFNIQMPIQNALIKILVNGKKVKLQAKTNEYGLCFFEKDDLLNNYNYKTQKIDDFYKKRKANYLLRSSKIKSFLYFKNLETIKKKSTIKGSAKTTVKEFLLSAEHLNYLISKSESLFFYLQNYRNKDLNKYKKVCDFEKKFCSNFEILYSNCENKTNGHVKKLFKENQSKMFKENQIFRIKTCKECSADIYLPFCLFSELDYQIFLLKAYKSQQTRFTDILRKKYHILMDILNIFKPQNYFSSNLLKSDDLRLMNLQKGINSCKFFYNEKVFIEFNIFLVDRNTKIVVSDIDGTVTKSDVWGNLYDYAGKDYTHRGLAKLYELIKSNGYAFIYLSTRPFSHYGRTSNYLNKIKQDGFEMPRGPIFLSTNNVISAIYTEIIKRSPHIFKISALTNVRNILGENCLKGGFGNKMTDTISYRNVGIPENRIFIVNSKGSILLNSGRSVKEGYNSLQSFVNAMFPAEKEVIDFNAYNDYSYFDI